MSARSETLRGIRVTVGWTVAVETIDVSVEVTMDVSTRVVVVDETKVSVVSEVDVTVSVGVTVET
jgi:hypothetical protein